MKKYLVHILLSLLLVSSCSIDGEHKEYDSNGNLSTIKNYQNGKLHGAFIEISGRDTTAITYYKNGIIDSLIITYFKDGNIKTYIEMEEDKQHGITKYYHPNNQLHQEVEWKEGYVDGLEVFYYKNGNIEHEGKNKNGVRHGEWKFYNEDGELLNVEIYDKGKLKSTSSAEQTN